MEFTQALQARHSIRDFSSQPVAIETLTAIVAAAQQTPSWANAQPWQVVIATGATLKKIRATFSQRTQQGVASSADIEVAHRTNWAASPRRNMADWSNDLSQYLMQKNVGTREYGATQLSLFNSPAVVYLTVPAPLNSWEIFDTGAFAQTLMLSAADHGVQSMPAYELVKYPDELRRLLGLDSTQQLLMGIGLGYASDAAINDFRTSRVATLAMLTLKD
ncbi:nitroreductase [Lactiplantibacillus daowaiensis]|uniref:Nitroreductase n=1 Tax=Lactiplantibacillus daowaiensis TaxID=2559918 RepID=A0ABW1S486_9LACO|nr:nitroreductase [Lactiplantibacillus daowaiensis]